MLVGGLVGRVVGSNWLSRHALITAFFPNLVAWTLLIGLGWPSNDPLDLSKVDTQTMVGSFLFIVWVMMCAYFTTNVQPTLLRWYRGDWPKSPVFDEQRAKSIQKWQRRISADADEERQLAQIEGTLQDALREVQPQPRTAEPQYALRGREVPSATIATLKSYESKATPTLDDALQMLEFAKSVGPARRESAPQVEAARVELVRQAKRWIAAVAAAQSTIRAARRLFPTDAASAGPTRLANVFATTDEAITKRYGLRPWLFTSHLRMVLPAGYAESLLDDAKLGLDLAVTLSALSAFYGGILAIVAGIKWGDPSFLGHALPMPPSLVVISALLGATLVSALLAVFTDRPSYVFWASLGVLGIVTYGAFAYNFAEPVVTNLARIGIVILVGGLATGGFVFARVNAIEAAAVYCEGIKTLFDAHRTKILVALRMGVPANLADERRVWRQLSDQLGLNAIPADPRYVVFVSDTAPSRPAATDERAPLRVFAAARSLPALHIIQPNDLIRTSVWTEDAGPFVPATDATRLTGHMLLTPVAYNEPITLPNVLQLATNEKRRAISMPAIRAQIPAAAVTGVRASVHFGGLDDEGGSYDDVIIASVVPIPPEARNPNFPPRGFPDCTLTILADAGQLGAITEHVARETYPVVTVAPQ